MRSTPEELDKAQRAIAKGLQDQQEVYVECRGMRHAWQVLNDFRIINAESKGPKVLRQDLECMRGCGTLRHDTYLLSFRKGEPKITQKVHAHYTYPDDYQIPGIPRGVKRQHIIHQERFRRAMSRNNGEVAIEAPQDAA